MRWVHGQKRRVVDLCCKHRLGKLARRWVKLHAVNALALAVGVSADEDPELSRLRRENERLREQRDILKKTLGILSDSPNNDSNALR